MIINMSGGGIDNLKFRVYAATSLPASGKENDVCIITSTPISGWEVFPIVPTWESGNGHVYIQNAQAYSGEYPNVNIIKKNGIWLFFVKCRQYENGTWVQKDAYQYRNGAWVQFSIIFTATINITYPAGSTCTATDGVTTLTAPDTGGTWDCTVPNAGTWTVTATDGSDTDAADVTITEDGQAESAALAFWHGELYTRGNTWDDVTGGWSALLDRSTVSFNSDAIQFNAGCVHATVYTNRPIDLTNFSKLTAYCAITATDYKFELGVKTVKPTAAQQSGGYVAVTSTGVTAGKTLTVDVSDLSGSYYILLYSMTSVGCVTNVKLS